MAKDGFLRKLWARLWLKGSQFSGRYGRLKALYAIEDPWGLGSEREQARFRHANAVIRQFAPDCGALLELGCGEGFQTRHLLEVADRVTGVELSEQAAERARRRCPEAEILVGKAEDAARLLAGRRFDVITAFEVLYYAQDVAAILAELQAMAPLLVVTNYMGLADRMGGYFEGPGWRRLEDLVVDDVVWRIDVWQAQGAGVT
jgi:SAM-dependent methyltransferase